MQWMAMEASWRRRFEGTPTTEGSGSPASTTHQPAPLGPAWLDESTPKAEGTKPARVSVFEAIVEQPDGIEIEPDVGYLRVLRLLRFTFSSDQFSVEVRDSMELVLQITAGACFPSATPCRSIRLPHPVDGRDAARISVSESVDGAETETLGELLEQIFDKTAYELLREFSRLNGTADERRDLAQAEENLGYVRTLAMVAQTFNIGEMAGELKDAATAISHTIAGACYPKATECVSLTTPAAVRGTEEARACVDRAYSSASGDVSLATLVSEIFDCSIQELAQRVVSAHSSP